MFNSYTKAAFKLTVTVAEADMLRRVIAAVERIDGTEAGIDVRDAHYASLGPAFAALLPRSDEDPFAGLLDLFGGAPQLFLPRQAIVTRMGRDARQGGSVSPAIGPGPKGTPSC